MDVAQENVRTGRSASELKQAILDNLYYVQSRIPALATTNDWYMAVSYAVRDRMMNDWIEAFGRVRETPCQDCQLSFGGVPHRTPVGQQPGQRA